MRQKLAGFKPKILLIECEKDREREGWGTRKSLERFIKRGSKTRVSTRRLEPWSSSVVQCMTLLKELDGVSLEGSYEVESKFFVHLLSTFLMENHT